MFNENDVHIKLRDYEYSVNSIQYNPYKGDLTVSTNLRENQIKNPNLKEENVARLLARMMVNTAYGLPKQGHNFKKLIDPNMVTVEKVIFNPPATIVYFEDGSRTVVKTQNGEPFDPEKGLCMALVKRMMGNKGNYYTPIRRIIEENYKKPEEEPMNDE